MALYPGMGQPMRGCLSILSAVGLAVAASLAPVGSSVADTTDAAVQGPFIQGPLLDSCIQCHGARFEGLQARGAPRLAGLEPWYLEKQLRDYRAGVRGAHPQDGYGMQMAFAAAMFASDEEIRRFAAFIAAVQLESAADATVDGDIGQGRKLYATCASCHGQRGEGNAAKNAPRLAGQSDWYLVSQLLNYLAGSRGAHPQDADGRIMAAAVDMLENEQMIRDLVAYINSLEAAPERPVQDLPAREE